MAKGAVTPSNAWKTSKTAHETGQRRALSLEQLLEGGSALRLSGELGRYWEGRGWPPTMWIAPVNRRGANHPVVRHPVEDESSLAIRWHLPASAGGCCHSFWTAILFVRVLFWGRN